MSEKITKKELADMLAEEFDISKKQATLQIKFLADKICENLMQGNSVYVPEIGKIEVVEKKAHQGINPKTLEAIEVPARKSIAFKASKALKDSVN